MGLPQNRPRVQIPSLPALHQLFEPDFNRAVKVQASDERITSDAGLLLLREADHRLGLTESLALGYSAQDDADRLAHDPAMKLAAWDRPGQRTLDQRLASQPTQSRLIDILTLTRGNRGALRDAISDACERHLRATGGDNFASRTNAVAVKGCTHGLG